MAESSSVAEAPGESKRRLQLALAGARMGVWEWNLRTNAIVWSPECLPILGIDRFEGTLDDFVAMVHPEDRERGFAATRQAIEERTDMSVEVRIVRADGQVRWISNLGRIEYGADGSPDRMVGTVQDITDRRRVAEELERHRDRLEELVRERTSQLEEARTRAEAATRAKSAFLANMSHEIRTPMNAILGLVQLLQRDQPTPAQADRLGRIEAATRHLLAVINDVLDLSKIEAGRLELDDVDFDLAELLESVRSLIADKAGEKHLALTVERGGVPLALRGDPMRLSQALLNLAGNAVKFTDRGFVAIRARCDREAADGVTVRFEVEDSGPGIEPEQRSRLFLAFEQADNSTTRRYGGSGLGLSIARHLARLMGGDAGVESTPGAGSTFWFTVRLGRAHGDARTASSGAQPSPTGAIAGGLAGARVLVAEDHVVGREVAGEFLSAMGVVPEFAEDGQQAVRMAGAARYDLILMDMQMPVLDGLDATRAIRRLPGYASVPIIAMTANAFAEDRQRCLEAGMNDHLSKPVDAQGLEQTMARWLPSRMVAVAGPGAVARDDPAPSAPAVVRAARAQLMPRFVEVLVVELAALREAFAAGRRAEAARLVHGLNGAAGVVGAHGVQATAAALERALGDARGQEIVEAALAELIEQVKAMVASHTEGGAGSPSPPGHAHAPGRGATHGRG